MISFNQRFIWYKMENDKLKNLLQAFKNGDKSLDDVIETLKLLPYEEIDYATIDHHRQLRTGFPEVIFGRGKSLEQLKSLIEKRMQMGGLIYITGIDQERADEILRIFSSGRHYPRAKAVTFNEKEIVLAGKVLVITAGTSDIPVAEEASLTARLMGSYVERMYDVGVAGIHRLLGQADKFKGANVIIVIAGMEGALPSVVGGLVSVPVIAVPTSVGYGTSFGGLTALLGMLNSCANGVVVVNIDNGFSAGYTAALINKLASDKQSDKAKESE